MLEELLQIESVAPPSEPLRSMHSVVAEQRPPEEVLFLVG